MEVMRVGNQVITEMSKQLTDTEFWKLIMRDVFGPREGGLIIVIDAENARKGVAKTSAAVSLYDRLAVEFGYPINPDDGVLSPKGIFETYSRQPGENQPSVMVWDEAVGGGAGDARRAMSNDNLKIGRAWQILRTKRIVTITTLPNWGDLDPRLQKLADYRLWCREWPIGQFTSYKVGTDFDGKNVETNGLGFGNQTETIEYPDATSDFPDVGNNDDDSHPLYESLKTRKEQLMDTDDFIASGGGEDEPEETRSPEEIESDAKREQAIKTVIKACEPWHDEGLSYEGASQFVEYSRPWVGNRIREWRDEHKYRELVRDPLRSEVATTTASNSV